jgi:F-type H+-transporting ATPase subunit c
MEAMSLTALGLGIIVLGAALGIGKIGQSAIESMSRQPEMSSKIQTAMIVAAALIEGVSLFAIVVAWLVD